MNSHASRAKAYLEGSGVGNPPTDRDIARAQAYALLAISEVLEQVRDEIAAKR